eukprot:443028-Rhodomonas_salina.1
MTIWVASSAAKFTLAARVIVMVFKSPGNGVLCPNVLTTNSRGVIFRGVFPLSTICCSGATRSPKDPTDMAGAFWGSSLKTVKENRDTVKAGM